MKDKKNNCFYEITNQDIMDKLEEIRLEHLKTRKMAERSMLFASAAIMLSFAILGFLIQHINKGV